MPPDWHPRRWRPSSWRPPAGGLPGAAAIPASPLPSSTPASEPGIGAAGIPRPGRILSWRGGSSRGTGPPEPAGAVTVLDGPHGPIDLLADLRAAGVVAQVRPAGGGGQ